MHTAIARAAIVHIPCLPYFRVVTYDLKRNVDRTFNTPEAADRFVSDTKTKLFNVYRIQKVNGIWSTAWYDTAYSLPA